MTARSFVDRTLGVSLLLDRRFADAGFARAEASFAERSPETREMLAAAACDGAHAAAAGAPGRGA
jgi:hypothetical protein